jgi:F0F1-type ATP synthase assembly protein I
VKFLPKPKPVNLADTQVSQGVELAVGIAVFFGIGFALDAWWGTTPVFMIVLTLFAVIGNFVKMYYSYSSAMRHQENERSKMSRTGGQ